MTLKDLASAAHRNEVRRRPKEALKRCGVGEGDLQARSGASAQNRLRSRLNHADFVLRADGALLERLGKLHGSGIRIGHRGPGEDVGSDLASVRYLDLAVVALEPRHVGSDVERLSVARRCACLSPENDAETRARRDEHRCDGTWYSECARAVGALAASRAELLHLMML